MFRSWFLFIGASIFMLILSFMGSYNYKLSAENRALSNNLLKYEERDRRLENMQKAILVSYNLTTYEARYYSFIFDDFSRKYNIPWEVFPALIKIESNFNPGVLSKEHAKGLTQVLEATGRIQANKMGIPFTEGTLWNSVLNIVIGFDYFSEGYAEKVKGTTQDSALKHAMRRYVGGPGYISVNSEIKEYKISLWDEYQRVSYVYKGILCQLPTTKVVGLCLTCDDIAIAPPAQ